MFVTNQDGISKLKLSNKGRRKLTFRATAFTFTLRAKSCLHASRCYIKEKKTQEDTFIMFNNI